MWKNLLMTRPAWSQTKTPFRGCCSIRISVSLTHYTFDQALALLPDLGQAHLLAQQTTATAAHAPIVPDVGNMDAHTQVC